VPGVFSGQTRSVFAPAGNAVVAVILSFLLTGTVLFSFAAQ